MYPISRVAKEYYYPTRGVKGFPGTQSLIPGTWLTTMYELSIVSLELISLLQHYAAQLFNVAGRFKSKQAAVSFLSVSG